ncbi:MAG: hypothetical protein A2559_06270 [Deltaproteobacteria bacterium RIFOXYD2_FULL_66_9]|nr:MAG: hypothetical protein A2559_06270 [Deltaproteobacteria bacterium RIFOXYD2_FULL_66_9]
MPEKKASNAARPPAEAPMPTMGNRSPALSTGPCLWAALASTALVALTSVVGLGFFEVDLDGFRVVKVELRSSRHRINKDHL